MLLCALLLWLGATPASRVLAQEPVRLAVLQTGSADVGLDALASALDPVMLGELNNHQQVRVASRPALDLASLQLAIDCVSETAECLRSATEQAGTEGLLAAMLKRVGNETLVTLLYFDTRGEGTLRTSTRRHGDENLEQHALDAVPGMVREALGLPAEAAAAPAILDPTIVPPLPEPNVPDESAESATRPLPVLPIVLTAVGAGLVTTGIVFGLAKNSTQDQYESLPITDEGSASKAEDLIDQGETEALLSNVFIGVGAAALVGGVVWWIVDANSHDSDAEAYSRADESSIALMPSIGPNMLGLRLHGRLTTP
jgi:hypothetical protein